jgi:hypothetical protein
VLELGLTVALLGVLCGSAWVVTLLPWTAVFAVGMWLIVLGMTLGVPAGLWYHVVLHRMLGTRGALGSGWWWHPQSYHDRLGVAERPRVIRWFRLGAVGFVLAVTGCILVAVGGLRSR